MIIGNDKYGNKVEIKAAVSAERPESAILTISYVKGTAASMTVMDEETGRRLSEQIFGKLEWKEE